MVHIASVAWKDYSEDHTHW